ncbi:MAG: hypothetical protein FD126_368 [Elusimicrobia bacterium]|nr:MAG: hypothetical protein FD126_368 [Elusimicrobiota bacterium]
MEDLFHALLKVFNELGLWKDGVELIGSWSFLLYQRHLGVRPLPLRTQDVDFLLPWPYRGRMVDLSTRLSELGFHPVTSVNGSVHFVHPELKLEFLTPEHGKGGQDFRLVKALGVKAVPLRFMDMLLRDSILVGNGALKARIPAPLNFCLHKLLIAQRRPNAAKREKDIAQAVYVLGILDPASFAEGAADLPPKWRALIRKSLKSAWELLPLERETLARFDVTPRK